MADIKKPSDLMHALPAQAKRLRKMERQLAVARTAISSISGSGTRPASTRGLLTAGTTTRDQVTVVTTLRCLISVVVEVTLQTSDATFAANVYLIDDTTGAQYKLLSTNSTSAQLRRSAQGSSSGALDPVLGGAVSFAPPAAWSPATGAHSFSLYYEADGTATITVSNRKLFAWVQPF